MESDKYLKMFLRFVPRVTATIEATMNNLAWKQKRRADGYARVGDSRQGWEDPIFSIMGEAQ